MPDIAITVQNTGADPDGAAGNRVTSGNWPAGFGHAALVSALRSRADGFDFHLWHVTSGSYLPLGQVTGANTASCVFTFNLAVSILSGNSDTGYRLRFGNLASQVTPFGTVTGPTGTLSVTASVPALALPAPGFPLERIDIRDVDENTYPEFLSVRRKARNQNPRSGYRLRWYHLLPDEWYTIRAHQNSVRGGAGAFSAPAWLGGAATYRYAQLPALRQSSRLGYEAEAMIEELVA